MTGVKFGTPFLLKLFDGGKIFLNSLLPSIALCIVKEKYPERQLEFGELLLRAIYHDGLSTDDLKGLVKCAFQFGFDEDEFERKMKETGYRKMAKKEFDVFKSSQFTGMPTLVLENQGSQVVLSNGYTNFDDLHLKLENHF